MECFYPRIISAHGVEIAVPCGKCLNCRINRTREWSARLLHESYLSKSSYFVTLTYDEEHEPIDNNGNPCVCKEDCQKFFKRLRKAYPEAGIRYFLGSEYGPDTARPHYHCIIFNLPSDCLAPCRDYLPGMRLNKFIHGHESYINRKLNDIWQNGFCTIGELCPKRVTYCAKYFVDKQNVDEILVPNFSLMSRNPGIGRNYADEISDKVRYYDLHGCLTHTGTYVKLPRYYDKKIFSDGERRERLKSYHHPVGIIEMMEKRLSSQEIELQGIEREHLSVDMLNFSKPKKQL